VLVADGNAITSVILLTIMKKAGFKVTVAAAAAVKISFIFYFIFIFIYFYFYFIYYFILFYFILFIFIIDPLSFLGCCNERDFKGEI